MQFIAGSTDQSSNKYQESEVLGCCLASKKWTLPSPLLGKLILSILWICQCMFSVPNAYKNLTHDLAILLQWNCRGLKQQTAKKLVLEQYVMVSSWKPYIYLIRSFNLSHMTEVAVQTMTWFSEWLSVGFGIFLFKTFSLPRLQCVMCTLCLITEISSNIHRHSRTHISNYIRSLIWQKVYIFKAAHPYVNRSHPYLIAHRDFVTVRLGGIDTTASRGLKSTGTGISSAKKLTYGIVAAVVVITIMTGIAVFFIQRARRRRW